MLCSPSSNSRRLGAVRVPGRLELESLIVRCGHLGEAVGAALGTGGRALPGEASGLARRIEYDVSVEPR